MLFGGTPDEYTALQRDGDDEIKALMPASSSCVLQRLLDRLALRVDLERLADAVTPFEIIAGLPNHVRALPPPPHPPPHPPPSSPPPPHPPPPPPPPPPLPFPHPRSHATRRASARSTH